MSIQSDLNALASALNAASTAVASLQTQFGAGEQAQKAGAAHVSAAVLIAGDMVTVNGARVHGTGRVMEVINPGSYSRKAKAGQSYPQIRVLVNGRKYHFNGDDIAAGKVTFLRKPNTADARQFPL